jgi:outer membrane protein OmpA-like peptidoglycan-associated protein
VPGGTGFSFVGHTFSNWNSKSDGSGTTFNVDSPLQPNSSMTLYAQWDALLTSKPANVLIGAVGSFATNSSALTSNLKTQILRLAVLTKSGHFTAETLYGYTNNSGSVASQIAISSRRANVVAAYLRAELRSLHVTGVSVTSAGEGTVLSSSVTNNRRVEVFVKG